MSSEKGLEERSTEEEEEQGLDFPERATNRDSKKEEREPTDIDTTEDDQREDTISNEEVTYSDTEEEREREDNRSWIKEMLEDMMYEGLLEIDGIGEMSENELETEIMKEEQSDESREKKTDGDCRYCGPPWEDLRIFLLALDVVALLEVP